MKTKRERKRFFTLAANVKKGGGEGILKNDVRVARHCACTILLL